MLMVDGKWLVTLAGTVQAELGRVTQNLAGLIKELAERYAVPLPAITDEVAALSARVDEHLRRMRVAWQ